MTNLNFKVYGLDCTEEVAVLKREVGPVVGGADRLTFDILNARMGVAADTVEPAAVIRAVERTGMRAEVWREHAGAADRQTFWQRRGRAVLTAVSGAATAAGAAVQVGLVGLAEPVPVAARVLYGLGAVAGLWVVLPKAWLAARRLRPDMNLLMTVAVAGAVAIGEWFEAATVAFLFAVSLALEAWSVGRARRAVAGLMTISPPTARVLADGAEADRPVEAVPVGSQILVRPGERIPLDGEVTRGQSRVNQAPITGESVPVPKAPGDSVFAGTVNGDGALTVRTTRAAGDTTLAHIIRLVGESQSRRAPAEQWVDRFAQVYTPAVLGLAILVALVPPLASGGEWAVWFYRALVLLVIACPCALVISTPVSIVAALAAAARNGVLLKGGVYVELPSRLRAFAFDKTGTLTLGRPAVVEVVPLNGHDEWELLERAAGLEARSEHPLARAVLEYAGKKGVEVRAVEDFQIVPGKGATGRWDGRSYWIGSHRYLEERGQETPEVHERLVALSGAGRTAVVVGNDEHVCGLIALADGVRPGARSALAALRAAGIEHLTLLTGDNAPTAGAVARQTGIEDVRAELLPAEKVAAVEELVGRYGAVAMVGDGVNDAPALARATVGVAMGAAGTDAAIETADIALMSDDLGKLPWLVRHSRRAMRVIRQNVAFSLGVKALFVVLTFVGFTSLWAAIAADTGASLLVIFNGLRLLRTVATEPAGGPGRPVVDRPGDPVDDRGGIVGH
jgi:Zn2+/Cd2+-exporting ATPase